VEEWRSGGVEEWRSGGVEESRFGLIAFLLYSSSTPLLLYRSSPHT
jgi:hypothetical protein